MSAPHDDGGPPRPLGRGVALAACGWLVLATLLYLAVRELGLPLLP